MKVLFVADDPEPPPNDFWALSDGVATSPQYLPLQYARDRIYYGQSPYTDPTATRDAIVAAINDGRLIVNYTGHGNIPLWGSPQFFGVGDVATLANGRKLPIVLSMTCNDGYFPDPRGASLAETFVRTPNKGALASWSPTGLGLASGHDFLDKGFLSALTWQGVGQLGPAAVAGKVHLWVNTGSAYGDLIDTFTLFGDPATRVNFSAYLPFVSRHP